MLNSEKLSEKLHILVVGTFAGDNMDQTSTPISIDRDNIDEVLARLAPRVDTVLLDTDDNALAFTPATVDDFHADELNETLNLQAMAKRMSKALTAPEAPTKIASTNTGFSLDDVLSATPTTHVTQPLSWEQRIQELGKKYRIEPTSTEEKHRLNTQHDVQQALLREVLSQPTFVELEQLWCGLQDLVFKTETSSKVKISILNAAQDQIDVIANAISATQASVLLLANPFSNNEVSAAMLAALTSLAQKANCHLIAHLNNTTFNDLELTATTLPETFQWQLDQHNSKSCTLLYPDVVARLPYGKAGIATTLREFEEIVPSKPTRYCGAGFLLCAELSAIYSENTNHLMATKQVRISDLPAVIGKDEYDESMLYPSTFQSLSEQAIETLTRYNISPVVNVKNAGAALVTNISFG